MSNNTTPKMESAVSISILKFDKSTYFKNIRHSDIITDDIFTSPYNVYYRFSRYCYFYCFLILILGILIGMFYAGNYVLNLAITRDHYGHSFNINGTCLCINSWKTSYSWHQEWKIYNLSVCDGVKSKNYTFTSETGRDWANAGDIKPCYTNSRCSRIFTSKATNAIIDESIYLYVGAIMIFFFLFICVILSIIYLCYLPKSLGIKIFHCFGKLDIKDHFEQEWKFNMNAKQRFDYWISATTRELNIFLSDSIYDLLLKFYDDDDHNLIIKKMTQENLP